MRALALAIALVVGLAAGAAATWLLTPRPGAAPAPAAGTPAQQQVLYWYDPMVPDQHFDKPGKSPFMDMQLVPKLAGSSGAAGVVQIDPRQVQNLGLRTARAERGVLPVSVRATGVLAFDERAVSVVQARVGGIVERLAVRAPLTAVKRGQALLIVLAPDWTAAQEEYLALRGARAGGLDDLRAAARQRLLLLGMSEGQVRAIEHSGQAQTRITITAPQDGVVGGLTVREGASVAPGTPLLRLNGLDTVWLDAQIPEAEVGRVGAAAAVTVELPAFPGERFAGHVDALLPAVDAATRTQTARVVLANPGHRLAPGMYARIEFAPAHRAARVLVPSEAVIATGTRAVVIVAEGDGRFRAQEIRTGDEAGDKTEVLAGLADGAEVVLSGQFLIDSEASLSGTLARLADVAAPQQSPQQQPPPPTTAPAAPTYQATGTLERIDGARWSIATDAIPELGMGAMPMTFVLAPAASAPSLQPGQRVRFSFRRSAAGAFEIERIERADAEERR